MSNRSGCNPIAKPHSPRRAARLGTSPPARRSPSSVGILPPPDKSARLPARSAPGKASAVQVLSPSVSTPGLPEAFFLFRNPYQLHGGVVLSPPPQHHAHGPRRAPAGGAATGGCRNPIPTPVSAAGLSPGRWPGALGPPSSGRPRRPWGEKGRGGDGRTARSSGMAGAASPRSPPRQAAAAGARGRLGRL